MNKIEPWKPKQRTKCNLKLCRWCEIEFTSEYEALYCSSRCRYAFRNETLAKKAKAEGLSIREFQFQEKLANSSLFLDF